MRLQALMMDDNDRLTREFRDYQIILDNPCSNWPESVRAPDAHPLSRIPTSRRASCRFTTHVSLCFTVVWRADTL